MLKPDILAFANSVDPDQLASEEASWTGSAQFVIKYMYMNLYNSLNQVIWLAENWKWAWLLIYSA